MAILLASSGSNAILVVCSRPTRWPRSYERRSSELMGYLGFAGRTFRRSLTATKLILNAGIGVNKFALTEPNNLDSHIEVNMLSQLHIALVLVHTLKATAEITGRPS
jgi:hypothetical protein